MANNKIKTVICYIDIYNFNGLIIIVHIKFKCEIKSAPPAGLWLSLPCDQSLGGRGGTTGRRSASTSASTSCSTWSRTAAGSRRPKVCRAPVPAAPAPRVRLAPSTSSMNSLLWWCIMGKASALATTLLTATTQEEVRHMKYCLLLLDLIH